MPIANECEYGIKCLTNLTDSLIKHTWVQK